MIKRSMIILAIYITSTIILMIVGFTISLRIDIAISIFMTFTFSILIILVFVIKAERSEEIKNIIQKNPNLSISALSEKTQVSEERIEKIIFKLKSEGLMVSYADFPSKEMKFKISKKTVLHIIILIVIIIILLVGIINTYIASQRAPNSINFRFWATFSTTSLVFLLLGFWISDAAEKGKVSPPKKRMYKRIQDFKIGNVNVFKFPGVGFKMISILLVILLYLHLLIPPDVLDNLFMIDSPVFLIFVILSIISITLILFGFFLGAIKINREKDLEKKII